MKGLSELTEERPQRRKMQNCKELRIMTSLRENTSPGNKGKGALWKKKKVGFQIKCKVHTLRFNFNSCSFERC